MKILCDNNFTASKPAFIQKVLDSNTGFSYKGVSEFYDSLYDWGMHSILNDTSLFIDIISEYTNRKDFVDTYEHIYPYDEFAGDDPLDKYIDDAYLDALIDEVEVFFQVIVYAMEESGSIFVVDQN